MIGSIALFVLAAATSAPSRAKVVHVPRVELPDFDVEVPELDVEVPDFDVDLAGGQLAMAGEDEGDEPDDDDDQADRDAEKNRRDQRKWYRDDTWRRFHGEDESFGEKPTARAEGKNGSAALAVKGPVTVRLRVQAGEVIVVASDKPQVAMTIHGVARPRDLELLQFGDRVEARIGGSSQLRHGEMRVEVPKGSTLDFASTSGDLTVESLGGDVRVRTMSGDVKVEGARNADVQSISGDVKVGATGPKLRLHIVSGNAVATTSDPSVQLNFESASGNLEWSGVCAKGCHVSTQTVSGQIKLRPDASKSSFALSYASHSGDLRDDLNLQITRAPKKKHGGMGGWLEAVYGKGEGVIECDAFSGDVILTKK